MRMATETSLEQRTGNDFYIEELDNSFRLHNVPVDGSLTTYQWHKELADNRRTCTQDEWVTLYPDEIPSLKDYFAGMRALHEHRDGSQPDLVKKVKKMFAKDFQNNWMATSTRAVYMPEGNDTIIHNYKSKRETSTAVDFAGPSGYIGSGLETQMEALLGTRNVTDVSAIFKWTTDVKPYLLRHNQKPASKIERAAFVYAYPDRVFLSCGFYLYETGCSRRVALEGAAGAR